MSSKARLWEKNIRRVVPYVPGEQPNNREMIKLNTNECPYPPSPFVSEILDDVQRSSDLLRLYPDTAATPLLEEIAKFYKVDKDMVFIGVGSDDVLANCFLTFFNSDKPILFPDITYSFYPVWAKLYRIPYSTPKLNEDFTINVKDYKVPNGGIILPNPNAPTSVYEPLEVIEEIVKSNKESIVIIDEAYIDFGGESALKLVDKYDNLLIVQTFSKSRSMAGMRLGYAIGNKELIKALHDVKFSINSYTINYPAIITGAASMKDWHYFDTVRNKVMITRENTKQSLKEMGFEFPDSKTNFIFATHKKYDINDMYNYLREKNIYVRHWDDPLIKDYLRITIGTDGDMKAFLNEVNNYMLQNS